MRGREHLRRKNEIVKGVEMYRILHYSGGSWGLGSQPLTNVNNQTKGGSYGFKVSF